MEQDYSMLYSRVNYAVPDGAVSYPAMQTMGDRIRTLREAKGWTQGELAARVSARGAKVTTSAVSQWERTETKDIKLRIFLALVQELGTTHEYLVHGPSDPSSRDGSGRFRRLQGGGNDNKP
jgi:transcriptional regulator with XRE-family HTH domain